MFDLLRDFPLQLSNAAKIAEGSAITPHKAPIHNILISGLGGSGIGGHAVIELCAQELKVPVVVNNSYELPLFVSANTLILLSSYSGNTEEVLHVAETVAAKGFYAVCITSGGKLQKMAAANGWDCLMLPSGFPPRTCFGYSVYLQMYALAKNGLISNYYAEENLKTIALLNSEQPIIQEIAQSVAAKLNNKLFGIFADQWFHSLTVRAKQQFNENSKSLCWANVFPEMNHNELVAWRGNRDLLSILLFRSPSEHPRNIHRFNFSKEVIAATGCEVIEIEAKGETQFQQYFYLVHLADWMSYYLAELQQYDPMEIDVLNRLKEHMSNVIG